MPASPRRPAAPTNIADHTVAAPLTCAYGKSEVVGYAATVIPVQDDADTAIASAGVARPPRLRWALAVALLGGVLLAVAFPPAGIWPLAVAGPALLAVALRGRSLRGAFCVGLVFGVAFFFPLLSWVLNVAWYAWLALAAAEAVIFGVLAIGQRLLLGLRPWPVLVAGWWVAAEALRDRWPWGGFPWGRLAMSLPGTPAQGWAAIGGAPFLSFVTALVGGTLAWLIVAAMREYTAREDPAEISAVRKLATRRTGVAALGLVAAVVAAIAPAAFPLDPVSGGTVSGVTGAKTTPPTAEVAAIQGDVPQGPSLAAQLNDTMVTANHAAATEKLAAEVKAGKAPQPDLVIWPENSTDLDPAYYPPIYAELMTATDAARVPLLAGTVLEDPVRNAGQLWIPGRGPTQVYIKRRLVPFGEVIPFRSLLQQITPLTALQPTNFTPGHSDVVFHVKNIRLGDAICYEIGFDDLVRSDVTAGANLLTMQTNDATFERDGQTGETGQQLYMARIRAVEHDRAVVVASTTGYSAIIDPDGRLVQKSGTWRQAILEGRVPLVTHTTLADRIGAWPEWVIVALTGGAAVAGAFGLGNSRNSRNSRKEQRARRSPA